MQRHKGYWCSAIAAAILVGFGVSTAHALSLAGMFTDHMVLQQKMADPVWGWDRPGSRITVTFAGHAAHAMTSAKGRWQLKIGPLTADAAPRVLTVSDGRTRIAIHDVLVGEVWVCSGQSNMQYPMAGWFGRKNLAPLLARANHRNIRLYPVPMLESNFAGVPHANAAAAWQLCTPQTAAPFSAVGYLFGRALEKKLHVPVGLIETDWGGTNIEPWIPPVGFQMCPSLKTDNAWLKKSVAIEKSVQLHYFHQLRRWTKMARLCAIADEPVPPMPVKPVGPINRPRSFHYDIRPVGWQPDAHQNPTTLFNGMVAPLIPFGIRGVIWYQGENNVISHDAKYEDHLKALILGWRKLWRQGRFPFYIMQIAPFKYWQGAAYEPLIWQAEEQAARNIPNCGIVPTMDIGEVKNIHPRNKPAAAARMADLALAKTYHVPGVVWSGPVFKSARFSPGKVSIRFVHLFGGLASRDGKPLNCFELAGPGGKFVAARAVIHGSTVVVDAPQVAAPDRIRFAWSDVAVPNLMNKAGWPALPFEAKKSQ